MNSLITELLTVALVSLGSSANSSFIEGRPYGLSNNWREKNEIATTTVINSKIGYVTQELIQSYYIPYTDKHDLVLERFQYNFVPGKQAIEDVHASLDYDETSVLKFCTMQVTYDSEYLDYSHGFKRTGPLTIVDYWPKSSSSIVTLTKSVNETYTSEFRSYFEASLKWDILPEVSISCGTETSSTYTISYTKSSSTTLEIPSVSSQRTSNDYLHDLSVYFTLDFSAAGGDHSSSFCFEYYLLLKVGKGAFSFPENTTIFELDLSMECYSIYTPNPATYSAKTIVL